MAAAPAVSPPVCPLPNTAPINDLRGVTRWMQDPEREAKVNIFPLLPAATVGSLGAAKDFTALKRSRRRLRSR